MHKSWKCRLGFHQWDREWVPWGNWNVGIKCLKCGLMPWGELPKRPIHPPKAPPPKPR